MNRIARCFLCALIVGCGVDSDIHRVTTGTPAPTAQRCARRIDNALYDDKLATACVFGTLDGKRVCLPIGMPRVISGMCDPKGGPNRIWIDRAGGCGDNGASRYALSTNTKACGELKGPIEIIADAVQPDQNVYLYDPQTHSCTPSGFVAKTSSPIVDRAPPPAPTYIYAGDLATQECK